MFETLGVDLKTLLDIEDHLIKHIDELLFPITENN